MLIQGTDFSSCEKIQQYVAKRNVHEYAKMLIFECGKNRERINSLWVIFFQTRSASNFKSVNVRYTFSLQIVISIEIPFVPEISIFENYNYKCLLFSWFGSNMCYLVTWNHDRL